MQIKAILLRITINSLARSLPFISARISYQLWTRTYRHKMPEKELEVFNSALKQKIDVNGADIMTYVWEVGDDPPTVLLLHGWNGRGTQLSFFVKELLSAGYGVVSFDAKGHGLSDDNHTNVQESVAIIKKLTEIHGVFFAMIGHSFGAMAAVNAINQGVACQKFIGISPPTEFTALLQAFSDYMELTSQASNVLKKYVLNIYGIASFEDISITGIAPEMTIPCLIIHDKNDDKVPLSQAQKAVKRWPGAKLHITEGLGHIRILHKPPALEASLNFLNSGS